MLSKLSHFDFICKTAVVCLFISESRLNDILIKNKVDLSSAVKTAKLRLKYHLMLKNHPDGFGNDLMVSSLFHLEEVNEIQHSPAQPLETEEEQLMEEKQEAPETIEFSGKKAILATPVKGQHKTNDSTSVKKEESGNKPASFRSSTMSNINKMKTVAKNNAETQSKKAQRAALLQLISKTEISQELDELVEKNEGPNEPDEKEELKEEPENENKENKLDDSKSENLDYEGSDLNDSLEIEDPLASMKFKDFKPDLENAVKMLEVDLFNTGKN